MSCADIKETLMHQLSESWYCRPSRNGNHGCVLVTDLLLPNNDCLELMIEELDSDRLLVHDMAISYTFLRSSGINLESSQQRSRQKQVETYTSRFNTSIQDRHVERQVERNDLWKGVILVSETVKSICGLIKSRQAQPQRDFKDRVYGYFKSHHARVKRNYKIEGYTKENKFDLRLNGTDSVLCRTISSKSSSRVLSQIERAWYAFDDVGREGHHFSPAVIYDDTEKNRREAWSREYFQILRKREIPAYGFESNEDQLYELATEHQ